MPAPTITPLPTPPSRSTDPANFAIEADAFVAALPEFATDANAQAAYLDALASGADADAAAAAASAAAALASQNAAELSEDNAAASEDAAATSAAAALASENAAASSEANAAASELAAASSAAEAEAIVAGIGFQDVVFINAAMSPYTVTAATSGKLLACDTSGNIIVNLPLISGLTMPFTVGAKKTTADANTLTINRSGPDTFDDGTTSKVLATVSGYTLLPDVDTAPDVWVAIAFGGANAGPATASGLTVNSGKVLGRSSAGVGAIEELTLPAGDLVGTSASQALSNKTLNAPNIINGLTLTGAAGTNGQVLLSQGAGLAPIWGNAAGANIQEFSTSGTWTKPSGAQFVLVEVWGAGGGGSRPTAGASNPAGAGGGGGSYNYRLFSASALGSTVLVTVGAGGTGGFSNGLSGNAGGNTDFGKILYGYGGGGGQGNATSTSAQAAGGGGGVLGVGSAITGGAPRIEDMGTSTSIIAAQNMGGGRGGGQTIAGTSTYNEPTGSASGFGGGGGCGAFTNAGIVSYGGGSSSYGGGGGGCGGYSTTGGSSTGDRVPLQGGGQVPTSRASGYGAAGGGAMPQPGLAIPYAADFGQGGCGGSPAASLTSYSNGTYFIANNGAQTVLTGAVTFPGGGNVTGLFVSSNGLANYTLYSTGKHNSATGIVYDGSKYVLATLNSGETRKFYSSIYSTTDFVNFTEYAVPNILVSASLNMLDNGLKYINGRYFLCMTNDLYYSSDLVTWTRANVAGGTIVNIVSVAYDGTRYYALRNTGVVYVSTDLISWTANTSGASSPRSIAASASLVIVAAGSGSSRYSTDGGVNWLNLPTIPAGAGRVVKFISSTNTWLMTTSAPDIYYSTTPTTSWTLATDSASATGYTDIGYNGTNYVAAGTSTGANVASATSSLASAFTLQAASTFTVAATPGGPGGVAGGGGGGAASSTTTSNGGDGGSGYCRVYTW